jgi:predicted nuclease of predicted toxin-antitoxin system
MRFKLDENLDVRLAGLLAEGGHDTATVLSQGLSGRSDEAIYQQCLSERRTLVTLDLDFANPLRFPPGDTEGIAVLRPPRPVLAAIREILASALGRLGDGTIRGSLWILEPGRIRVYRPEGSDAPE